MEDKKQIKLSQGLAIKIIIPVLIVAVITGIWVIKNEITAVHKVWTINR